MPQASNKAWGLVAETVKDISLHHGRVIRTHRGIWLVVVELALLVGNAEDAAAQHRIIDAFWVARSLHSNFYENKDTEVAVIGGLITCEDLSVCLYSLFW